MLSGNNNKCIFGLQLSPRITSTIYYYLKQL